MDLESLLEKLDIGESQDFECKRSEDKVPKDAWKSISAFANTEGGYVVLGVAEKKGRFQILGVNNPKKQLKDFWDNHNNSQKLNVPICNESDINIETIEGKALIVIKVPQATRTQRPVYINNNPMTGTYKRNWESDYPCTEDEVRQMFRDASSQPQDSQIIENFNLNDIDPETMKAYRQRFSSREPDHPWLALSMVSFIPEDIEQELRMLVGDRYCYLKELDRLILVLAHHLGEISNNDIQSFTQEHSRDIGDCLKNLVDQGWLEKSGRGRGTHYSLPKLESTSILSLLQNTSTSHSSSDHLPESSDHLTVNSDHLPESSDHLTVNSDHLPESFDHLSKNSDDLPESSDHLSKNSDDLEKLKAIAKPVREKRKVSADVMRKAILEVCEERFLTLQQLGAILNRTNNNLRTRFLSKMVEEGLIELQYPDRLNHPGQAYRTKR